MSNATELFPQLLFWEDAKNELNDLDGHQKKMNISQLAETLGTSQLNLSKS